MNHEQRLDELRQYWDNEAANFDEEPDHGLRDPAVRQAWLEFLAHWLPPTPSAILDIGCGTGSLSLLMASLGYTVTGIDLSPAMIAQAEAKALALGYQIPFKVMNAAYPQLLPQKFDLIVCRHLLWTLPEPSSVLQRWTDLLTQPGCLLLIEGFWHTGGGLHAEEIVEAMPSAFTNVVVQNLSDNHALWGNEVTDERYAVIADLPPAILD